MDAVALLRRAQEVGLRVEPIGDKLLVRGPKRAEAVVELLAAHKAEVLAALAPASTSKCTDQDAAVAGTEARRWRDRLATRIVDWFHGDRGGRRLGGSPGVTWRTNGTNSTVGAVRPGNAQAATRRSAASRR